MAKTSTTVLRAPTPTAMGSNCMQAPAGFDPTRPTDGSACKGPGFENTRESFPGKLQKKLDDHLSEAAKHLDEARQNFFSGTVFIQWTGTKGDYYIRSFNKCGQNSELQHKWPQAFVNGQSQTVNAAMWLKHETDGFILVSVWTFSEIRDKNFQFYKTEYGRDSWDFCDVAEGIFNDEGPNEHFGVGQDYWANQFHCVPLDVISASDMTALESIPVIEPEGNRKGKKQRLSKSTADVKLKYTAEDIANEPEPYAGDGKSQGF